MRAVSVVFLISPGPPFNQGSTFRHRFYRCPAMTPCAFSFQLPAASLNDFPVLDTPPFHLLYCITFPRYLYVHTKKTEYSPHPFLTLTFVSPFLLPFLQFSEFCPSARVCLWSYAFFPLFFFFMCPTSPYQPECISLLSAIRSSSPSLRVVGSPRKRRPFCLLDLLPSLLSPS